MYNPILMEILVKEKIERYRAESARDYALSQNERRIEPRFNLYQLFLHFMVSLKAVRFTRSKPAAEGKLCGETFR